MRLIKIFLLGFMLCYALGSSTAAPLHVSFQVDTALMLPYDGLQNPYIFPDAERQNKLADSLKKATIVENGDFISWMKFADTRKGSADSPEQGDLKKLRPLWVLIVVFVLFLMVGLVRFYFPGDFHLVINAYFDERALQQLSREDNLITSWPYIFLYIIFSFSLGLFLLLYQSVGQPQVLSVYNFLTLSLFIGLLFILKILVIRFLSYVFFLDKIVREYVSVLYLVYFNSMLFLMPFLLTVTMLPAVYFNFILILFVVIVSVLFVYRFVRTAIHLFGAAKFSIFYLILYLCTLEIAPILILVKTLRY